MERGSGQEVRGGVGWCGARADIGKCGGLSGASERDRVGVNNKHTATLFYHSARAHYLLLTFQNAARPTRTPLSKRSATHAHARARTAHTPHIPHTANPENSSGSPVGRPTRAHSAQHVLVESRNQNTTTTRLTNHSHLPRPLCL